jgi:hypothetical protein
MPYSPGPPVPHPNPVPGSNAIGTFVIGTSPIGTIPPFDWLQTLLMQYANSKILFTLCNNMAQYIDPTLNLDEFFDVLWNVDTAIGVGLDNWGAIVGVGRVLQLPNISSFFGFEESGTPTTRTGFGQSSFFSGQSVTGNFTLTDAAYRPLVLTKALANICDGSIPAVNQILINLFPGIGNSYVADGLDMTETYTFSAPLSALQQAIVQNSGVLPRTVGVTANVSFP